MSFEASPLTSPGSSARLSTSVYEHLKFQILSGALQPGDRIKIAELCKAFKVSRQPVIQALHRLAGEWLVEILPQVGCRVATHETRALMDLLDTFGDMEAHVARLAAQRRTREQLIRLRAITEEICLTDEIDMAQSLRLGQIYQLIVLEMANSPVLAAVFEKVWTLGTFAFITLVQKPLSTEMMRRANNTRRALTQAIEAQDAPEAERQALLWITATGGWYQAERENENS